MGHVAKDNGLIFRKDVKLVNIGTPEQYYAYIKNNENMTYYGVVWCTSEWSVAENFSIPCKYQHEFDQHVEYSPHKKRMMFYSLFYNYTNEDSAFFKMLQEPAPIDPVLLRLKLSVDNAIMKYLAKEKHIPESDIP